MVLCNCSCGNQIIASIYHIKRGATRSCRCLANEMTIKRQTKHGFAPLAGKRRSAYHIWRGMKNRCYNPKFKFYSYYGGRGITICARWRNSFVNFLKDMGEPRPGMSIERKDNNGNYCPSNCVWIPRRDQAKNMRSNWKIMISGEIVCASEAGRILKKSKNHIKKLLSGKDKSEVIHL